MVYPRSHKNLWFCDRQGMQLYSAFSAISAVFPFILNVFKAHCSIQSVGLHKKWFFCSVATQNKAFHRPSSNCLYPAYWLLFFCLYLVITSSNGRYCNVVTFFHFSLSFILSSPSRPYEPFSVKSLVSNNKRLSFARKSSASTYFLSFTTNPTTRVFHHAALC